MSLTKDHRQPNNPRNNFAHDEANLFLKKILKLLPEKPIPLTLSQQFQVAKTNRLLNTPLGGKPNTL
jgi:hypothetical protein